MAMTYLLRANQCPGVPYRSTVLDPKAASPTETVVRLLANGHSFEMAPIVQEMAKSIEAIGAYGGGAWAIAGGVGLGLELYDPGNGTIGIRTGSAVLDAAVVPQVFSVAPVNNAFNYVFLNQSRSPVIVTSLNADAPPAAPAGACAYLGRVQIAAGAFVGSADRSGVLELRGNTLYRRTADAGAPTDTPPASLLILTQTAGGYYLWTGAAYVAILDSNTVKTSGTKATTGFLEDLLTAGTGISLALVDVGAGVWKIQVTSTVTDTNTDTRAAVDSADTPGYLENKFGVDVTGSKNANLSITKTGATSARVLTFDVTPASETFVVDIVQGRDLTKRYSVDFSPRCSFGTICDISVAVDQGGAEIAVLHSGRSGTGFKFDLQTASDTVAGSHGAYSDIRLTFTIRGFDRITGATPAATISAVLDTYNYDTPAEEATVRAALMASYKYVLAAGNTAQIDIPDMDGALARLLPASKMHHLTIFSIGASNLQAAGVITARFYRNGILSYTASFDSTAATDPFGTINMGGLVFAAGDKMKVTLEATNVGAGGMTVYAQVYGATTG